MANSTIRFTQMAASGRSAKLSDCDYILVDENWNDYGYYTLFSLYKIMPSDKENVRVAQLRIFNPNQKFGERTDLTPGSYISFIVDVESAEKLCFVMSPEERKALIKDLNVQFDNRKCVNENAYLKSVLRDKTETDFLGKQSEIQKILNVDCDIKAFVERNKSFVNMITG